MRQVKSTWSAAQCHWHHMPGAHIFSRAFCNLVQSRQKRSRSKVTKEEWKKESGGVHRYSNWEKRERKGRGLIHILVKVAVCVWMTWYTSVWYHQGAPELETITMNVFLFFLWQWFCLTRKWWLAWQALIFVCIFMFIFIFEPRPYCQHKKSLWNSSYEAFCQMSRKFTYPAITTAAATIKNCKL